MIHHFDHRWASYRREAGSDVAVDVAREDKQNPGFAASPRYWVEAREVRLRVAKLPKGLLSALRDCDADRIALEICHLLFLDWLHRGSGGSVERAIANVFPSWIDFVAHYPFAREVAPTQIALSGTRPACIESPGPSYLPAAPIDSIKSGPRSSTAWYAEDPSALRDSVVLLVPYFELLESVPPLRTNAEASAFAEELLARASPRWMTGSRKITRSTDERTLVGGVLPFSAAGDSLQVWTTDHEQAVLLPAATSCLACDFAARFKVGGINLNFFVAEQMPILPPEVFDRQVPWGTRETIREWLLPRVLELTYTDWDLAPFATDCGWVGPPFRRDDTRRFLLRCELNAAFFHLYLPAEAEGDWRTTCRSNGCPRDETPEQLAHLRSRFPKPRDALAYIMDTFAIVRRKDEGTYGKYRTKQVILEIYDKLQESGSDRTSYQTQLEPPPADISCCHQR